MEENIDLNVPLSDILTILGNTKRPLTFRLLGFEHLNGPLKVAK